MDDCCDEKTTALVRLRERQAATLRRVLAANATMFGVEFVAGWLAGSVALLADSLDMLGDAFVYAISLWVVGRGALWQARAALAKAFLMGVFGAGVILRAGFALADPSLPGVETMRAIGATALAVNGLCFAWLWHHRVEDIYMRSVWLCSRNDLVANVALLGAAAAVAWTRSPWPDIVVGGVVCALFLHSATEVARNAWGARREALASR